MWIELHDSSRDHPKILKLARLLGIKPVEALGHMASLWTWTLRMAPDGDLSSFDVDDIEIGAQWEGQQGQFTAAAVKYGLLEACSAGFITVHEWSEYASHLKAAERKRQQRARQKLTRKPDNKQGPVKNVTGQPVTKHACHSMSRDVTGHDPNVTACHADRPTDRPTRQTEPTDPECDTKQVLTKFPPVPTDLPPLPSSSDADDTALDWFTCVECSKTTRSGTWTIEGKEGDFCEECFNRLMPSSDSENFIEPTPWPMDCIQRVIEYVCNEQNWQIQLSPKQNVMATQLLDGGTITKLEAEYAASIVNKKNTNRERNAGLWLTIIEQERVKLQSMPKSGSEHAKHEAGRKKRKSNRPEPKPVERPDEQQWLANQKRMKELTGKLLEGMDADGESA